jgi:predicted O-methyltransferase YrrM
MNLDDLLRAKPQFHQDASGNPYSWQVSRNVLSFIDRHVSKGSRTLEVGAGVSTVLFALKGAIHLCVVPFEEETVRIKAFCREHDISTDTVTFKIDRSDRCLPQLQLADLDLVLIDGGHGFPIPFLDWHYTAEGLRVGGLLIIDDTQLWTGHTLKMFLMDEPEWMLEVDYAPRSVVFRKVKEGCVGKHESSQPYVVHRTLDLLFDTFPKYVEEMRPFLPPDLVRGKERSLAFRAYRARRLAQSVISRVLPSPVKVGLKALLGRRSTG